MISIAASDELAILARPASAYEAILARNEVPSRALARSIGLYALVLGAFISFVTSGRLVAWDFVFTWISYAFLPLLQTALLLGLLRASHAKVGRRRAVALFFAGAGGFYLFWIFCAAVCLFAPDVGSAFAWLLKSFVLPVLLIAAIASSMRTTIAFFRVVAGQKTGRAALSMALYYLAIVAVIVGWYVAMNQLPPLLWEKLPP